MKAFSTIYNEYTKYSGTRTRYRWSPTYACGRPTGTYPLPGHDRPTQLMVGETNGGDGPERVSILRRLSANRCPTCSIAAERVCSSVQ